MDQFEIDMIDWFIIFWGVYFGFMLISRVRLPIFVIAMIILSFPG